MWPMRLAAFPGWQFIFQLTRRVLCLMPVIDVLFCRYSESTVSEWAGGWKGSLEMVSTALFFVYFSTCPSVRFLPVLFLLKYTMAIHNKSNVKHVHSLPCECVPDYFFFFPPFLKPCGMDVINISDVCIKPFWLHGLFKAEEYHCLFVLNHTLTVY